MPTNQPIKGPMDDAIDQMLGGTQPTPAPSQQSVPGPMDNTIDQMTSGTANVAPSGPVPDSNAPPFEVEPPEYVEQPHGIDKLNFGKNARYKNSIPMSAQLKAVYADSPITKVKIYAQSLGRPIEDFRVWGEDVYFKNNKTGKYILAEADPNVLQIIPQLTNPAVVLGTLGSFAASPVVGGALGAAGGEGIRKAIGGAVFNEPQTVSGNLYDIGIESVLALGGGMVGKAGTKLGSVFKNMGQGAQARTLKLAGRDVAAGLLTPAEHAKAAMLKKMAEEIGVDLAPHQLYDRTSMLDTWKYLKHYPETADIIQKFETKLAGQSDDAINKFVKDFGGAVETPYATGKKLQEAATGAMDRAWKARQEAAEPFYKEAFAEGKTVNIKPLVDWIDAESKGREAIPAANLKKIKELLVSDKKITKRSLRGLDDVKKTFDKMLESYGETGLGATEKHDLRLVKEQMLKIMDETSPAYANARATHAEFSKPLESLRKGIIGQVAEMESAKETAGSVGKLFSYQSMPDKMLLREARKEITASNPELWDDLVGTYIRDAWNMTKAAKDDNVLNAANAMYKKFINNPSQRQIMAEALGPKKTQAWESLLTVLKRASIGQGKESMTQPLTEINRRMTGAFGSKTYQALSEPKQAAADWFMGSWNEMLMSKHQGKLLTAMTDPDAIKSMAKIKALSPTSKKFISATSEFTALIMNKIDWDKMKRDQEFEKQQQKQYMNQPFPQPEPSGTPAI